MMPPPLTIHLFGSLRVTVRGEPLPRVRSRRVQWLLALLTLRHGRPVQRVWLAGTLWPESSNSRALQSLRDDLLRLRRALGPESGRIEAPTRDMLTIDLAGAVVDVLQFDAAIQAGDEASLRSAVELYSGPLLEDCLEEWAFSERATRAEQFLAALEALADRAAGRGNHGEAVQYLRRAAALDPLRDTLPRRLMSSLAAAGDPAAAIQTYRDFRLRLQEELAAAPDEATTRLFHEIRATTRLQAAQRRLAPSRSLEPETADPGFSRPVPESLPRPLTSLIGREQELEEVRSALEQGRLVTLVGGGGVGKTRLALEVARQAADEAPGGAAWVELGPLADGALVLPSVASALSIRAEGDDAEALTRLLVVRLTDSGPLLVLDNCEHLLDATAALVQTLLQRCPGLRILVTSRQRLGLPGETAWRVPSLPAPDPQRLPAAADEAVAAALNFAAVRLFVERSAAVQPGFRLTKGAAAAVGLICQRLDGIPLAIELAAARMQVLTPQQIAERLDGRFKLLTRGTRGALPRHQTLRALIDWSYDSLPAAEAALLRRLSVFAGGWTLEAAEAVCADVLDPLDSLVDRSLVLVDEVAEGLRYRLLETVREYAREKLAASGELAAVRKRHQAWYLGLAERAYASINGPEEPEWLTRLEAELDNLRAALAWCQAADADPESECAGAPPAAEEGLRLASALWWFWYRRGNLAEGQQWLEAALARGGDLPPSLRAPALLHATYLANARGERETAASLQRATRQEYEKALALAQASGDRRAIADATLALAGMARDTLDVEGALRYAGEARQQMESLGDRGGLNHTLAVMATLALSRGDRQSARPLLEELLAICRELGDSGPLVHALGAMGHLERDEGEYARARAFYEESLVLRRDLGHQFALAQSLEDFAVLAGRERQAERAIRLLGAVEAFCETIGAQAPVADRTDYERTEAAGRAALGEPAFAAAWAEGRALSLDRAIEYALGDP
jgi:predicted ATPase/DNA-binding SARP family transcriptional activator